ncbi:MAG: hypothetical protein ACLUVC_02285 [Longibaculum sp.]
MWSCKDCKYLNKSRKKYNDTHYCFRYGCDYRKDNYVCGWIKDEESDKSLKEMGCSNFKQKSKNEQLSLF